MTCLHIPCDVRFPHMQQQSALRISRARPGVLPFLVGSPRRARARLALASVPVSSTAISRCWVLAQMAPARPTRGTVAEWIGQNPASARAQLLTSSATPVAWGSAYARFPAAACCLPAGHTAQWHKYFLIWSGYKLLSGMPRSLTGTSFCSGQNLPPPWFV